MSHGGSSDNNDYASKVNFTERFIISGSVGCISKTLSAPLERVKLLMQSQDELIKKGTISKRYIGIQDCIKRTYKAEGFIEFWRGNWANCIRYFPTQALTFGFKGILNEVKTLKVDIKDTLLKKLLKNTMSGGISGSGSLLFVYSLDYCRTRMGNDVPDEKTGQRKYKNLRHCYSETIKTDGIQGLYRGFATSCFGIFIYRGFYFGLYDTAKPILLGKDNSFWKSFILGYIVTAVAETIAYPSDTVRRRMMMKSGESVKYKGGFDCLGQIIKNEGIPSLYKGCVSNIMRGVSAALVLSGYDKSVEWYVKLVGK